MLDGLTRIKVIVLPGDVKGMEECPHCEANHAQIKGFKLSRTYIEGQIIECEECGGRMKLIENLQINEETIIQKQMNSKDKIRNYATLAIIFLCLWGGCQLSAQSNIDTNHQVLTGVSQPKREMNHEENYSITFGLRSMSIIHNLSKVTFVDITRSDGSHQFGIIQPSDMPRSVSFINTENTYFKNWKLYRIDDGVLARGGLRK